MAYDIDNYLLTESNRIGEDIYKKSLHSSPFFDLIEKDVWPDEMGTSVSVMTYQRSLPANTLTWNTLGLNTGTGNSVPSAEVIEFAQTLRTYNLQQTALESPKIDVNDLRFTMKRREQLANVFRILQENTRDAWINRNRSEYTRIAEHKMIATTGLPEGTASFPLTQPTSRLTQGILDSIYMRLVRDGAGPSAWGRAEGSPVFAVACSSEASRSLIRDNAEIRDDFRYAAPSKLLSPYGVRQTIGGWYHLIDDFMPRWDFVNGAWVERRPYAPVATTNGNKWDINPLYEAAAYEDSIVFIKDVMKCLIPKPITSPGGNTSFDPVSYAGDWKWLNYQSDLNPDKTIGYFRGILSSGTKPVFPEYGFVVRSLRCPSALNLLACS